MRADFPPVPQDARDVEGRLEVYRSVLPEGRHAWYVSSPITTGRRLRELQSLPAFSSSESIDQLISEHVIEPNRRDAREYVSRLRDKAPYVIDPTAVREIQGWSQDDYRFFWGRVIETFVTCVVFRDGWESSSGCNYEFLIAVKTGVTLLDEKLRPMGVDDGVRLLAQTNTQDNDTDANGAFRAAVLEALLEVRDVSSS